MPEMPAGNPEKSKRTPEEIQDLIEILDANEEVSLEEALEVIKTGHNVNIDLVEFKDDAELKTFLAAQKTIDPNHFKQFIDELGLSYAEAQAFIDAGHQELVKFSDIEFQTKEELLKYVQTYEVKTEEYKMFGERAKSLGLDVKKIFFTLLEQHKWSEAGLFEEGTGVGSTALWDEFYETAPIKVLEDHLLFIAEKHPKDLPNEMENVLLGERKDLSASLGKHLVAWGEKARVSVNIDRFEADDELLDLIGYPRW